MASLNINLVKNLLSIIEANKDSIVLTKKQKFQVAACLGLFCRRAIVKFIKGQKEHGGRIQDRDLYKERLEETIDLFFYNEAENWKYDLNEH